jgi:Helix-turn-helix domain
VEHREANVRQAGRGASGDDAARFLHELRQLRDEAGLGQAELAARAHYPYDLIRAAEVGPSLPDLPVLSAYVRGCGGTTEEWEERWRSLTRTPSLPVSDTRQTGRSEAATAGARIGSATQVGDAPDPSIIMAALNRVAEEMASPGDEAAGTAAIPPVPDFPPSGPVPSDPFAVAAPPPDLPARPTSGWDPIRVSSAWPVLVDPGPTASAGPVGDSAAPPWEAAPWGKDPLERTQASDAGAVPTAAWPTGGRRTPAAAGPSSSGRASSPTGGSAHSSSRIALIVAVIVVLCVLAVLLAVFA